MAGYLAVVPLIAVVSPLIAGIGGPAGIVVQFAAAAATYWLSLQVTEFARHRLLRR